MRKPKASIKIKYLIEKINDMLGAPNGTKEGRQALIVMLESILHETNSYNGFKYIYGWPCNDNTRVYYFRS